MPPPFVSIKNLEKYQHYTHRNPPWVKLYYSLLDDPAFLALDEVQQCRYIKLIMLASRQMNCISTDPEYLGRVMRIAEQVDVTPLIDAGFLIASRKRQSNKMLSPLHENRSQSRVEKSRVETEKSRVEPPISPKGKSTSLKLPEWVPLDSWQGYLEMRKTIKRPLSSHGQRLAIATLDKLNRDGHSPQAVLDQSTLHSWQGLFAPKEESNGQHTRYNTTTRPRDDQSTPGKYAGLGTIFNPDGED